MNGITTLHLSSGCAGMSCPAHAHESERELPLVGRMRRGILKSPERMRMSIAPAEGRPLTLLWVGAGHTAGVGLWMSGERVDAISLCLGGIDREEDFAAIVMASKATPNPFPPAAYHAIVHSRPPLLATLFCDTLRVGDPAIATAAQALATAFFGTLGIAAGRVLR